MVDLYKKYYLDSETIKEILQNGIVVFDTSALLDTENHKTIKPPFSRKNSAQNIPRNWMPMRNP